MPRPPSPDPDRSAFLPARRTDRRQPAHARDAPPSEADAETDGELTERLRSGEDGVVAVLYARHLRAALAFARSFGGTTGNAEDLASEAFARTLAAVRAGAGPTGSWRPYLLTVVRNTAAAWATSERRTLPTADIQAWAGQDTRVPSPDQIFASATERELVLAALHTLPERWRAVLLHSVVEQRPVEEIADLLGMTPSGASSLLARAREGLRQAYLSAHLRGTGAVECLAYEEQLKALARRPARRRSKLLTQHLEDCVRCRSCFEEMCDVNRRLRLAETGNCFDVGDYETLDGALPYLSPCTAATGQRWYLRTDLPTGAVRIVSTADGGRPESSASAAALVTEHPCSASDGQ
ncbi:sigma-70 family RNA polymerase sigma factor [Streptomyces sp. NBC_00424]|uniref:sigma-70 family RNA polymerase sigma factor n=1 Tax=Streptomyces sp. NBC_00424 TaxID=2903648 RepID=UPI002253A54D|nr:sigma-70 family RNA polymerase sigma factor [Streptomyces sp. NBC_00424]MCX5077641.1 sigma-70 family RNA polymerase sigma factor [Streptomyces sp. NBC_00424]MCX5078552.1 sigma-70 family RNA polymerase sigma factor [Streptomyces sp. NBC_00424]MCX5078898.1 sigma-70 family RNA polymerase sigma factor [Streptomyces sp. NBC_00424]